MSSKFHIGELIKKKLNEQERKKNKVKLNMTMKNMKRIIIICTTSFMFFISCNQKEKSECYIIDIENTIYKEWTGKFLLNDITQSMRLIPIETSDSVLLNHVLIIRCYRGKYHYSRWKYWGT